MKIKEVRAHMRAALVYSELSYDKRRKVGCLIVNGDTYSMGYNGTPPGWDNTCETPEGDASLSYVIHAEANALDKFTRSGGNSVGAIAFTTDEPCAACALRFIGAKISTVYYLRPYRLHDGLELLKKAGIQAIQLEFE